MGSDGREAMKFATTVPLKVEQTELGALHRLCGTTYFSEVKFCMNGLLHCCRGKRFTASNSAKMRLVVQCRKVVLFRCVLKFHMRGLYLAAINPVPSLLVSCNNVCKAVGYRIFLQCILLQ